MGIDRSIVRAFAQSRFQREKRYESHNMPLEEDCGAGIVLKLVKSDV